MNNKISIIVPIYNVEEYIFDCLDSISNQTYTDFEVLLINDGSKDNSKSICLDFIAKDSRFIYYEQENKGVSEARNLGIEKAKGEWICFVDPDDDVENDYLSSFINNIENDLNYEFVIQDFNRINSSGKYLNFLDYDNIDLNFNDKSTILDLKYFEGYTFNKLYRREILIKNNIRFDNNLTLFEDFNFYMDYLKIVNKVRFIKKSEYNYYYRVNSATNRSFHNAYSYSKIFKNYNYIHENFKNILDKSLIKQYTFIFIKSLSAMNKLDRSLRKDFLKELFLSINFNLIESNKYRFKLFKILYQLKLYNFLILSFEKLSK